MSLLLALVPTDELDAAGVLGRAESALAARRAAEVEDLRLGLAWADLHASDPRSGPNGRRAWCGQDRLVEIGGEGTPAVQELCMPEFAIARQVHTLAARAMLADALDLRHRLPKTWAVVQQESCEVWVARKVAAMSRGLDATAVGVVDSAVADALAGQAPSRVLNLAEAKVIEADTEAHRRKVEQARRRRLVNASSTDEHGSRTIFARMEPGDVVWVDAIVDQVADLLASRADLVPDLHADITKDELRAIALGWLGHPARVLDLLDGRLDPSQPDTDTDPDTDPDPDPDPHPDPDNVTVTAEGPAGQRARRTDVVVYLHLHQGAVDGTATGLARVEHQPGLAPLLRDQVARLAQHSHVVIRPVIDLHAEGTVSAYEFPETIKERVHLRCPGEVFPHASRVSRNVDLDHPDPYRPAHSGGPPGQTSDRNVAKLGRTHHRAKTHLGYQVEQTDLDRHVWRSPNGLHRVVGPAGTELITEQQAFEATHPRAREAFDDAVDALWQRLHDTG